MFICSCKASTLKITAVLLLSLLLLSGLFVFATPTLSAAAGVETKYRFDGVKTEEDRQRFLKNFGWEVDESPVERVEFTIPAEFDRVMLGYNELQKELGLDLSRYKKKTVERYTYLVKNYEGYDGKVYCNLIVYRGRVVGGDVSSADPTGFAHNLERPERGAT